MRRRIFLIRHCQSQANADGRIEGKGDSPLSAEGHIQDHRIREGELGWMEDLPYTEVGRHMREKGLTELTHEVHGGESLEVVGERLWEALAEAMAGNDDVIILVSHGYSIQALLRRLDPDISHIPRFIGNGDVVELWLDGGALAGPPTLHPLNPAP